MKKYTIGYTCGVFDLLHIGHLNLLENCKNMCRYLIVAICDDEYVREIKKTQPIIPLKERMRLVGALECVDEVVVVNIAEVENKMLVLEKYKFNVLFSGDDWKGSQRFLKTQEQFSEFGVNIEYLPYTKNISTSAIKSKIAGGGGGKSPFRFYNFSESKHFKFCRLPKILQASRIRSAI